MSDPDYSNYTLEELREARGFIDSNRFAERAARLDLLIRDREKRARKDVSVTAVVAKTDASKDWPARSARRSPISVRNIVGVVIIFLGIYGIGAAALLMFAKSALEDPQMAALIAELGPIPNVFSESLFARAAVGFLASGAYCLAGLSVILGQRRAMLLVLVAAGLATVKQLLELGIAIVAGGLYAFIGVPGAIPAISIHLGLAAIVYFTETATETALGEGPHN